MAYFALIGPVFLYIAIRPGGGKWRDVWRVYFAPTAASIIAIGAAILFGRWIQKMQLTNDAVRQVLRLVVIMLWSIVLYIPLIRIMAPEAFKELLGIPADVAVVAGVTVGKPKPDPSATRASSRMSQRRRPLDEVVRWERW